MPRTLIEQPFARCLPGNQVDLRADNRIPLSKPSGNGRAECNCCFTVTEAGCCQGNLSHVRLVHFASTAIEDRRGGPVSFIAAVNGSPVKCSISAEALEHCFHADPAHHEAAFHAHRREIEEAAEALIRVRGITAGELRIEVSDLESSIVAFGRSVRSTSQV
ncbi:hypothetical protein AYO47_09905, partial [Planctomyces sp. SCGC AG-212-M04]